MDIQTELDDKMLEALAVISQSLDDGVIAPSEARVALTALFTVGAALISQDVFEVISQLSAEVKERPGSCAELHRTLTAGNDVVQVVYTWGSPIVRIRRLNIAYGKWIDVLEKDFVAIGAENPFESARDYTDRAVQGFISKGYKEVL